MITLRWSWHCLTCDAHGEGDDAERASNRHMRETKHPVAARGTR